MEDAVKVMRLRCGCGRNLADVTLNEHNPMWTRDKLLVTERPNVKQEDHRPWHEANKGGLLGSPGRAAAVGDRVEGKDFDWHDRTYTWHCRCGQTHTRRHERISAKWVEYQPSVRPIEILIVGRDL